LQALKAPSAFSKKFRVATGIQVVVKLSNFYVQEKDKNTLGTTKRERQRVCEDPFLAKLFCQMVFLFFSKWQKKVLMDLSTHQLLEKKFISKNHQN
jgi:hypothetical protein